MYKLHLGMCIYDVLGKKEICPILLLVVFMSLLLFESAFDLYFILRARYL